MSDISYPNKDKNADEGSPEKQWRDVDANEVKSAVNSKVDKVAGKQLSTEDFTTLEKAKVANVPANTNTELAGKQSTSEKNQPSGYAGLDSNGKIDPSTIPVIALGDLRVVADEAARLAITDARVGETFVRQTDTGELYVFIGEPESTPENWVRVADTTPDWSEIQNKPTEFTPSEHTHAISDVTGLQHELDAKAADNAVVKLSGSQTIEGDKTFNGAVVAQRGTVTYSADHTLELSDRGKFVILSAAAIIHVPADVEIDFPVNTEIEFIRGAAGGVTFDPDGDASVLSVDGKLTLNKQYSAAVLKKVAANTWYLIGDLKA